MHKFCMLNLSPVKKFLHDYDDFGRSHIGPWLVIFYNTYLKKGNPTKMHAPFPVYPLFLLSSSKLIYEGLLRHKANQVDLYCRTFFFTQMFCPRTFLLLSVANMHQMFENWLKLNLFVNSFHIKYYAKLRSCKFLHK